MAKTITYAVHPDGYVISRVGSEVAWPILDWPAMRSETGYQTSYILERVRVFDIGPEYSSLRWTKKLPVSVKNQHRKFWGMSLLKSHSGRKARSGRKR